MIRHITFAVVLVFTLGLTPAAFACGAGNGAGNGQGQGQRQGANGRQAPGAAGRQGAGAAPRVPAGVTPPAGGKKVVAGEAAVAGANTRMQAGS